MERCREVCLNSCAKARNGRCSDGWLGDESTEGKPSCALGTDCADCGVRELCRTAGGSKHLLLPRAVLAAAPLAVLRPVQVLFVVMGSSRLHFRSERAYSSWCRSQRGIRCLFVADDNAARADAVANHSMPLLSIAAHTPESCCSRRSRSLRRHGFFCNTHRAVTLRAQYHFLPALLHVKRSAAFASGAFKWVVLIDDDAFVFVQRIFWLLTRLDAEHSVYAGDFGSSGEATHMQIPHFACGGGGSVLSAAALRRMDVARCMSMYHTRCMQSDWMIGGCARLHNVSELRELGCGTCDPKHINIANVHMRLREDRCFFVQNSDKFAESLPLGPHSGAIVHTMGMSDASAANFFHRHARRVGK